MHDEFVEGNQRRAQEDDDVRIAVSQILVWLTREAKALLTSTFFMIGFLEPRVIDDCHVRPFSGVEVQRW